MASSSTTPIIEDGTAKRLWNKFKYERTQALYTPFVVSLAAGTLELDNFLHYIAQDVHILRAFAQAYEMVDEYADDNDAKVEVCKLRKSVTEMLIQNNFFIQTLSLDLHKESTLFAATVKYTEFLLETASGKVEGVIATTPSEKTKLAAYNLSAMTPRMRLYAFLGKELQALLDPSKGIHPNQKWIESFSSNTFQAEAMQTEKLLEKLSVSLTGEELDIIEKLYHEAMKLEVEFFLAQPLVQNTIVPLFLDSSAILAELAILTASKSDQPQSENQLAPMSSAHLRSTWEELSKQYTEEYEQCIESILVGNRAEKFDYEGLKKAIQHISDFEKKANMRVIGFEVLKGLSVEDIQQAGEHMILQDGCMDFFRSSIQNGNLNTNIHVISYCWSGDLIKSAFSSGGLDSVNVHANELMYENSISTGQIIWKVVSPIDKIVAFNNILQNSRNNRNATVYIGATVSDLLCLLDAHIGIVIGCSSSLRRLGVHFGLSFIPLLPFVIEEQQRLFHEKPILEDRKVLYTVSSWAEIHAFILGF
ncbi:hypothetical protein BUALT_Bualt01G0109000 [Buddleja alternifolia]|uniref:Thiaminase-2/PQQC domain-containing protein n=1 Tax=Buddleja alternifolia TaxID=168488 RepID=A0AAV6YDY9_9LAMI|nr:hypothetical protein BUALT_Bualt01G0109000 [Buddleja alternifolia]